MILPNFQINDQVLVSMGGGYTVYIITGIQFVPEEDAWRYEATDIIGTTYFKEDEIEAHVHNGQWEYVGEAAQDTVAL